MSKKFAFVFPGQGSQSVGMMQGLSDHALVRETFEEASQILGVDFWAMVTEPNELLNQTEYTQPLMLTAAIATWRLWHSEHHVIPDYMAGHSLGEYSALVAAESISFTDALPLVKYRAQAMQAAVADGVGAMAAILGLDDEMVKLVCTESAQDEVLEAVNFNSPGQVVIAGNKSAVERGMVLAKEKGAKRALLLPVSVPSHCALMQSAADKLADYLKSVTFHTPNTVVLHNADVLSHQHADAIKDALVKQLFSPVRWVETIRKMSAEGATISAECGPGKVLAGLNKRIVSEMPCSALINKASMDEFFVEING